MNKWTCTWSMAGCWLVKTGPGLPMLTLPQDLEGRARLIAAAPELRDTLQELFALAKGECPSLFDEDSGGDGGLSIRIEDLLADTSKPF